MRALLLSVCAGAMLAVPALAQEETALSFEEDGTHVYLPDYFARFSPQTAADMVRNLPGFQIRQAANRRGLGQGGVNVLIDGVRVSGKSNDPLDQLRRTSRDAVVRVEVVDGATLGISGLSGPVANVILNRTNRTGNFEWHPQFRKGVAARINNGAVSMTGMARNISYTVGVESRSFRNGAWGEELVTGPSGELLERRYEQVQPYGENPQVNLALGHKDTSGREANFNASFAVFDFEFTELSERTAMDPSRSNSFRLIEESENEWNTEVSGDYAFDAFGGRMKLIGFQSFEHSPYVSASFVENDDGFVGADRFVQTVDEGESIFRAEQIWDYGEGRSLEFGFEGAFNFNEVESAQFTTNAQGIETPVDFDGANSRIEERRGELSATYNFPFGDKLDVQASLAFEYSNLQQSGDVGNSRSFTRPKGFISVTYPLGPKLELRGRIDRRVGQLAFSAFASSVNLADNNISMGNSELVPQQSWFLQGAIEKKFADDSQITLTAEVEEIEDIVQRIPIGSGDGVGNVPEAKRWRIEFNGTQMLEKVGIPGGQLEWDITFRGSDIEDPFTKEVRRLNGETKYFYNFAFRHDIPNTNYSYRISVDHFANAERFRRNQISLYEQSKPKWFVSAEHKDLWGMNAELYVYNLTNYRENFRRDVFDGTRGDSAFLFREVRSRAFDPIVGMNISKTF